MSVVGVSIRQSRGKGNPKLFFKSALTLVVTSRRSVSRSCIHRLRHCRAKTLVSISAMFSQLPCHGVWYTSNLLDRREVSAG